jgi:class 3 adenylate cyclase/tetratricopeptide (TPR) repeat protein
MFCDLVGSTALSARLDPEDMREIIGAYHRCCTQQITKVGGFVAKYMGDGVLAYFGYPQAHEDDAERAVRAALLMTDAVPKLRTEHDATLQVRVGIATGLVVVGDLIGEGDAQERGVVGDTPNLAARLQAVAEPGRIVISHSTRRLTGGLFDYRDLGHVAIKGLREPVQAWRVTGTSAVQSRFEARHETSLTALVGREEELELLLRRWQRAKSGEGQVVLLSGEPGIGKSRLTAALLERVATEPHTRLRYFCSPQHTDSALYPIMGQMERAAGLAHDDTPKARLDKLDAVLAQTSTSIQDAALFADMLSFPNDGRYPALELAPQQRRQRTLEALTAQLVALAAQQPVLMIFEDAHWIDPTSLEALGRIVDRIKMLPALLVVTYRPEFVAPWVGQAHVTSLTINRLGEREAAAIIARLVGNKGLSADVMAEIVERTDGIPLFVEEMTKAVLEAENEDAALRTVAAVPSPALAVPASLHASLMARLDRLGPAKEVAQIGAAIGREFSHALLAAVMRRPEAELGSALDRLFAAGLLFRQGVPPHATYLFKHALVQDAAYGTLLREPKRALHARIAETLQSQFAETAESQPEIMARHYAEGGAIGDALSYWHKAGQLALSRSANSEAASYASKGLALLGRLPNGPARDRHEWNMQSVLAPALIALKGYTALEPIAAYERARDLLKSIDDPSRRETIFPGLCAAYFNRGEFRKMAVVGQEFLSAAERAGDPNSLYIGHWLAAVYENIGGRFPMAQAHAERALAAYDAERFKSRAWSFPHDLGVSTRMHLSIALWHRGCPDQSAALEREATALAARLGHQNTVGYALFFATLSAFRRRDLDALGALAIKLEAHGGEHGMPHWTAMAPILGWPTLASEGRIETALERIPSGLALCDALKQVAFRPAFLCSFAEAQLAAGRAAETIRSACEALELADGNGESWIDAELWQVKGRALALTQAPSEDIEECFRRAEAVALKQGSKMLELRASTSLARLWRDQGKRNEARDLLAPIYGWFTEGFDTPDLKEAKALLAELS